MTSDEVLYLLSERHWWAKQLADRFSVGVGDALIMLVRLASDGRVRRLQSGAWALSLSERNRRRRRHTAEPKGSERVSPTSKPLRTVDPLSRIFLRPKRKTKCTGLWG